MKNRIIVGLVSATVLLAVLAPVTDAPTPEVAAASLLTAECQLAADYGWSNYSQNQLCIFVMQANDSWEDGVPDWLI